MRQATCPHCSGRGRPSGHILCPSTRMATTCATCNGTGAVSVAKASFIGEGDKLRDARMTMDLSLREAARKLGIGPALLSDAEMGRVDPAGIRQRLEGLR